MMHGNRGIYWSLFKCIFYSTAMSKYITHFMATNSDSWLTNLPTNHFLVPLCQWFVSCIGVAAWDKWHGSCYHATEWYAYVFTSTRSLLVWSTGAKDLPRRHEWFWCPCCLHLTNRIFYWRHGVFLWFHIIQVLNRPVLFIDSAPICCRKNKKQHWQPTPNKWNLERTKRHVH